MKKVISLWDLKKIRLIIGDVSSILILSNKRLEIEYKIGLLRKDKQDIVNKYIYW